MQKMSGFTYWWAVAVCVVQTVWSAISWSINLNNEAVRDLMFGNITSLASAFPAILMVLPTFFLITLVLAVLIGWSKDRARLKDMYHQIGERGATGRSS